MYHAGRRGIATAIMSNTRQDKVLVSEVLKKEEKSGFNKDHHDHSQDHNRKVVPYDTKVLSHKEESMRNENKFDNTVTDTIFLLRDNIKTFETFSLEGNIKKTVCQYGFCCDFKIKVATLDPSTKYRLVAFNGLRIYGTVEAGVQACGIIQCSSDLISSCGSVQESKTVFGNIELMATFYDYKNILIMPSTLRSNLLPLSENWTYDEHTHDDHVHISMSLDNNTNNLITFGIYSRYFKSDTSRTVSDAVHYFVTLLIGLLLSRL